MSIKPLHILGLTCGPSLEVVKASLISTDGIDIYRTFLTRYFPLPEVLRQKISSVFNKKITNPQECAAIEEAESLFTEFVLQNIEEFRQDLDTSIDLIGLEGPTICHDAPNRYTYQLGKGQIVSNRTGLDVISHFHNTDILNGGQGAPIGTTYFNALALSMAKPTVFVNIGGISSIHYIGPLGELLSFDCGPGNALLNDYMLKHAGIFADYNGKMAALGQTQNQVVTQFLRHDYFSKYPPKALDRGTFSSKAEHLEALSLPDGAKTICEIIAQAVISAVMKYLPEKPLSAYISGGGARNPTLMRLLRQKFKNHQIAFLNDEQNIEVNEASMVAFLSARRYYSLPITFPSTTGVSAPLTGGKIYHKEN